MRDQLIRALISIPVFSDLFFLVLNIFSKLNHNPEYLNEEVIHNESSMDTINWFIRISAPRNTSSKLWGDLYFAKEIQASLAKSKITSQILFRGDKKSLPKHSVNLVIRGIFPSKPVHGAINVLWVISHPNQISVKEINSYDFVFAASEYWAKKMTKRSGKKISVLNQATNPEKFYPSNNPEFIKNHEIVFVGNSSRRKRKVIQEVIDAGFFVEIYGSGWHGKVPTKMIKSTHLENSKLPELYRSSQIVLNDHWEDMRINGFVSNRIFDAIASGANVVSDQIENQDLIFNSRLHAFTTREDFAELVEKLKVLPNKIDHDFQKNFTLMNSFDARVETLTKVIYQI